MEGQIRWVWWLLPIFLTIVGGLICYFVLRDRDKAKARRMLYLGLALAVPHYLIPYLLSGMAPW